MLILNGKYLRNLHTNQAPAALKSYQCYHHDQDERDFNRDSNLWTIGIFITMVVVGGSAIACWIRSMPY